MRCGTPSISSSGWKWRSRRCGPEFFKSERRLELLRQEVRAAREVMSPNVCRIFDLVEVEGRELVSMEYVDGATLLGVLQERGPLDLKEAQDIASQFLAGLEAIHKVGLIHRDIKPENIMLTRAGRVVVMDFGLAREETEGGGTVAGTPAYMAPEQAAGQTLDARADVYAAGVVLAEMVSPDGIKSFDSRQSVWEGVRSEPAKVPDTPWAPVIQQAVKKDREGRFNSAHTLTRALEDVTLRVEGAEDLHPYPGLASFTEDDAEYFFGREAEVEQMWRKLEGPTRMLGLVGPSGAGKTSFLQAGLIANAGSGWVCLTCKPGTSPQLALSRALAPEMTGDVDAMDLLLRFDDPEIAIEVVSRWGQRSQHAVVIVDQFEELYTQNGLEEQRRFAELLNRLVLDSDVHVLLSMRDDFLLRCHDHEALAPLFSDLTPLRPPAGAALRRALVQPATKCGYRFEDDDLIDEMLAEVEGERGALPLLAFAAARLWEMRDRDTGLLTREAYRDIGGVGGALAQHAEATIDRIGVEKIPIVRELFRNLVTAEGTRAVREWNELLSVFSESHIEPPEDVLRALVDARLLTSYEVREDENEPTRRVEIIHESLLANWPRLVRWQTQDADGAQLRDQLRQAAQTWEERGRSDDMIWTGSSYREFASWRERYPGGLSDTEEAFSNAMTALAGRRRRSRRVVVAAGFAILLAGLAIVGSFWQRSVLEANRAEAATLLSQAQLELESYPSAAVAYATASLELADNPESRLLALEALWKGPTAYVVSEIPSFRIEFTPDGQWLVQTTDAAPYGLHVIGAEGADEVLEDVHDGWAGLAMALDSGVFATFPSGGRDPSEPFALWSAPEKKLLAKGRSGYPNNTLGVYDDLARKRFLLLAEDEGRFFVDALNFEGISERLGEIPFDPRSTHRCGHAPNGEWFAIVNDHHVSVVEVGDHSLSELRRLDHIEGPVADIECDPLGQFIAASYGDGKIRLWDLAGQSPPRVIDGPPGITGIRITGDGSMLETIKYQGDTAETWIWSLETKAPTMLRHIDLGTASGFSGWTVNPMRHQLVSVFNADGKIRLWPLSAPADSEPVLLRKSDIGAQRMVAVHPTGDWVASSYTNGLAIWPVSRSYPVIIDRYQESIANLAFAPDGRWLVASSVNASGTVRLWQLAGDSLPSASIIHEAQTYAYGLSVSPDGEQILLGKFLGVDLLSLNEHPPQALPGAGIGFVVGGVAISPDGMLGAASTRPEGSATSVITVWDLASHEVAKVLETGHVWERLIHFGENGRLLSEGESGLWRWDLETGAAELLLDESIGVGVASSNGARAFLILVGADKGIFPTGRAVVHDVDSGLTTPLDSHGDRIAAVATDAEGIIVVSGDEDGVIRVGPADGGEPHALLGHSGQIRALAVDPLGRWIASSGQDNTIRLWPMPDLSKPPLHALPREELIAKLKTLTNLRVVRDSKSSTGWKLTVGPFPGWETVPAW